VGILSDDNFISATPCVGQRKNYGAPGKTSKAMAGIRFASSLTRIKVDFSVSIESRAAKKLNKLLN